MLQFWQIGNQERLAAFEFRMETDYSCSVLLPSGATHSPKGFYKKKPQSWEIFTEKQMVFYCIHHLDHCCCFMTLPPEAAHSQDY
jgi:hypothetical protein